MKITKTQQYYFLIYIFFTGMVLVTSTYPFFWDTVQLASRHAHYFYQTNFNSIILPNDMDSGHIPTLGIYLALIWKFFGKTLIVSHLSMLPFVLGIVYQSIQLTKKIFPANLQIAALLLLLADATLLAQCTLVSPDIWVVLFFIMALNYLNNKNRVWFAVALTGLSLASMRGMMCTFALFIADFVYNIFLSGKLSCIRQDNEPVHTGKNKIVEFMKFVIPYIPAALAAGSFLGWHYIKTGWIGYHKNMPWYGSFEYVDFKGFLRNIFILGWRLADFGRLFLWFTGIYCLWHYFKYKPAVSNLLKQLLIVFVCFIVVLSYSVLLHKSLSAHRYLLPVYLVVALSVSFYLFLYVNNKKVRQIFFTFTLIGMLSGNFWVYPDNIAKGWDASLAYIPYFHLRDEIKQYMKENNIAIDKTGSDFPNIAPEEYISLSGSYNAFAEYDMDKDQYIFYSNIFNNFSSNELYELKHRWQPVKFLHCLQVKAILYKKTEGH